MNKNKREKYWTVTEFHHIQPHSDILIERIQGHVSSLHSVEL